METDAESTYDAYGAVSERQAKRELGGCDQGYRSDSPSDDR